MAEGNDNVIVAEVPWAFEAWFEEFARPEFGVSADEIKAWLVGEEFTTRMSLLGMQMGDLPAVWSGGRSRVMLSLTEDLRKRPRIQAQGDADAAPIEALVGASRVKSKYLLFLNGEELKTASTTDATSRVLQAQVVMRMADADKRPKYGLAPTFEKLIGGEELSRLAREVEATQMAGIAKSEATSLANIFWLLGGRAKMPDARVWTDSEVLWRVLTGEWDKYELGRLSLADFHHSGASSVSTTVMVGYPFIRWLLEALAGLESVLTGLFSEQLQGVTAVFAAKLENAWTQLTTSTEFRLFTSVNDVIADFFRELRTGTEASLNGAKNVKVFLASALDKIVFTTRENGAAMNEWFQNHRLTMYVLPAVTTRKATKPSELDGGDGKEKEQAAPGAGADTRAPMGTVIAATSGVAAAGLVSARTTISTVDKKTQICVYHLSWVLGIPGAKACTRGTACEFAHDDLKDISKDSAKGAIVSALAKNPTARDANLAAIDASTIMKA
jgi:hypothetical protein